ncbi:hypothetical protein FSP39_015218 [Pinctada imbricata]|uniref:Uncharacterized protein n=1 Tax=Pinctada imbricata TaxID=66713 RepID=A0AA89BPS4_PINIB|nr:hypothetical protein FSP39_015218 [Pinctada imbricata]
MSVKSLNVTSKVKAAQNNVNPIMCISFQRIIYDYPITVYTSTVHDDAAKSRQRVADLGYKYQWKKLVKELKKNEHLINSCLLPVDESTSPQMYTPLHHAAFGKAPQNVFEVLINFGASKSLKTADGQTAYDIANRKGLDEKVLKMIEVPHEILENETVIKKMEVGLHKVILERVEKLVKENGQQLPQLSFLYEFGSFFYPVPGMYGGFSVSRQSDDGVENSDDGSKENNHRSKKDDKTSECAGEQVKSYEQTNESFNRSGMEGNMKKGIVVESWCRIAGGSGQRHEIDKEGIATLVDKGFL